MDRLGPGARDQGSGWPKGLYHASLRCAKWGGVLVQGVGNRVMEEGKSAPHQAVFLPFSPGPQVVHPTPGEVGLGLQGWPQSGVALHTPSSNWAGTQPPRHTWCATHRSHTALLRSIPHAETTG